MFRDRLRKFLRWLWSPWGEIQPPPPAVVSQPLPSKWSNLGGSTQPPIPFGQAPECVSCNSKNIVGYFTQEGFENHCRTCGHRWIGKWPAPVITVEKVDEPE